MSGLKGGNGKGIARIRRLKDMFFQQSARPPDWNLLRGNHVSPLHHFCPIPKFLLLLIRSGDSRYRMNAKMLLLVAGLIGSSDILHGTEAAGHWRLGFLSIPHTLGIQKMGLGR